RYPNPHLAFGAGIHSCPGKNIAKSIVEVALHELITGTGDLELTIPEDEIPLEHWPFQAALSLPARITPPAY
ncbi:MAG: cytochrome P450, partial [Nocardioides sp.]|nr:cytochrome P450 [Nocardioides sp.]